MNIQVLREGNNPDINLPLSHTCFFGQHTAQEGRARAVRPQGREEASRCSLHLSCLVLLFAVCLSGIDLPLYTTEDILYNKLLYAIENTSSIDGDSSLQHSSGRRNDPDNDDGADWGFE
jgi:hypothetical protein